MTTFQCGGCRPTGLAEVGHPEPVWRVQNSVVRLIMRPPSDALGRALSGHPRRDRIDPERARAEHAAYVRALEDAAVAVTLLPPEADMPDACFTWDTILAFPSPGDGKTALLVAARPGAPSRRRVAGTVVGSAPGLAPGAPLWDFPVPGPP